jgi:hypothetical protein
MLRLFIMRHFNVFLVRFTRFKFGQGSELERSIRYLSGNSPFLNFIYRT